MRRKTAETAVVGEAIDEPARRARCFSARNRRCTQFFRLLTALYVLKLETISWPGAVGGAELPPMNELRLTVVFQ